MSAARGARGGRRRGGSERAARGGALCGAPRGETAHRVRRAAQENKGGKSEKRKAGKGREMAGKRHLFDHLDHALLLARLGLHHLAHRARVDGAQRVGRGVERLLVHERHAGAHNLALVVAEPVGQVCSAARPCARRGGFRGRGSGAGWARRRGEARASRGRDGVLQRQRGALRRAAGWTLGCRRAARKLSGHARACAHARRASRRGRGARPAHSCRQRCGGCTRGQSGPRACACG